MRVLFVVIFIVVSSCKKGGESPTAQQVVNKAIEKACNGNCERATVQFNFRKNTYKSTRLGGSYTLERTVVDSTGKRHDVVTNEGLKRFLNGAAVAVADSLVAQISDGVNSVHYFAQLPYGLNAPAVQKEYIGINKIKGRPYHEISVTFTERGGGTDFDDTFLYWVHTDNFTVDYLAYKYAANGGGVRFREAYNPRVVSGMRFVDYNNYKPKDKNTPLVQLAPMFGAGELQLLSKIEIENIVVTLLDGPL